MQNVFRKLYSSILAATFIIVTSIATTFAWVGMITSSSLGSFDVNLQTDDEYDNDYYLLISAFDTNKIMNNNNSGERDVFRLSVPAVDIQKQILFNMDKEQTYIGKPEARIGNIFAQEATLNPVTTNTNLTDWRELNIGEIRTDNAVPRLKGNSKSYFCFDIYLTVDTYEEINSTTNINASVFLKQIEDTLGRTFCSGAFLNGNQFKESLADDQGQYVGESDFRMLFDMPNSSIPIDASYAARVAFELYDPIDINESYAGRQKKKTIIFQKRPKEAKVDNVYGLYPSIDQQYGLYSFGGILPEKYNTACKEIEKVLNISSDSLKNLQDNDSDFENRMKNDLLLIEENSCIWKASEDVTDVNKSLGIIDGNRTKMKITVYFWFEGWDADCINFIDSKSIDLNLRFATDKKNNT